MTTPISLADLRYHRRVFELLGRRPHLSAEALTELKDWQAKYGVLPASVLEWYSLQEADILLNSQGMGSHAMPRKVFLRQALPFADADRHIAKWYVESHTDHCADLVLDGQDDPPLEKYLRYPGGQTSAARERFESLSIFIVESVWQSLFWPPHLYIWLRPTHGLFGPAHLDYLLERYGELFRMGPFVSRDAFHAALRTVHAFKLFEPGLRIQIDCHGDATTGERRAHWSVSADSIEQLHEFLRSLFDVFGYMPFCVVETFQQPKKDEINAMLGSLKSAILS